ncbi:MAG: hypothetical protein RBR71_11935 [Gudongella sp.]|nr:hypothetical protein [Gudongella sp.]
MHIEWVIGIILFIIVISIQLSLNLILKELKEIKEILKNKYNRERRE